MNELKNKLANEVFRAFKSKSEWKEDEIKEMLFDSLLNVTFPTIQKTQKTTKTHTVTQNKKVNKTKHKSANLLILFGIFGIFAGIFNIAIYGLIWWVAYHNPLKYATVYINNFGEQYLDLTMLIVMLALEIAAIITLIKALRRCR